MSRRELLAATGLGALGSRLPQQTPRLPGETPNAGGVTLFLCGDVMTGRGVDQVLPHPGDPELHEPWVRSAQRYVELAEETNGPIPAPVEPSYVWGDALAELERRRPAARIVNLETSVTTSNEPWPGKGIHYRMHPRNVPVLGAAGFDVCVLANNHVLDWGRAGLVETLETLDDAGLRTAGAGRTAVEAAAPAVVELAGGRRLLVFAYGLASSGIPPAWAATPERPGLSLLPDLSPRAIERVAAQVRSAKRPGDLVVASLHWGGNWGYAISEAERRFAQRLVEEAGVDVLHGHSSHHPKGIEVWGERLVLYGCGDFLNDYEGIGGREEVRPELVLMVFAELEASSGRLLGLEMTPLRIRRFRLELASPAEVRWLRDVLDREGRPLGTSVELTAEGRLALRRRG